MAKNNTAANPPLAPRSIRTANTVIIGGGPCGSVAAAFLNQRGVPVTLIERISDFSKFDVSRSYSIVLFYRGRRVLSSILGLLEYVSPETVSLDINRASVWGPDGKYRTVDIPLQNVDGSNLRLLRSSLLQSLQSFVVDNCESVTTMYGTNVDGISFGEDGEMELSLNTGGRKHYLRSRLVLACDGRKSVAVKELVRAKKEDGEASLVCSNGFGTSSYQSPAVGLNIEAVLLNENFTEYLTPSRSADATAGHTRVITGKRKKRPKNATFSIVSFPLLPKIIQRLGGTMANIAAPPDHDIWKLKEVEEAYSLFEDNCPQANIRQCISPEHMRKFIDARPSTFCPITRQDSLAFHVGGEVSGGVLLMGDASHSFPPDTGQGVNAAFEDVALLAQVLDESQDDTPLTEVLGRYEKLRDEDVSALMKIARFAAPYQYRQNMRGFALSQLNGMLRVRLAKFFPGLFHPGMIKMVYEDLSFREIALRADLTTRRLYLLLVSLILVPGIGLLLAFHFAT